MDNNVNKDNDKKKITYVIIAIMVLMITTTGSTYAWLALSAQASNAVNGTVATANLGLTVSVLTPSSSKLSSSTGVMVPQKKEALSAAINSTNSCVDGNGNVVCYVLQITIKNNSTANVVVNGDITFSGISSMPNLSWKPLTNATTVNTTTYGTSFLFKASSSTTAALTSGSANSRLVVSNLSLNKANSTTCTTSVPTSTTTSATPNSCVATYFVVLWINELNAVQTDTGTWVATVAFNSSNGTGVTSTITSAS